MRSWCIQVSTIRAKPTEGAHGDRTRRQTTLVESSKTPHRHTMSLRGKILTDARSVLPSQSFCKPATALKQEPPLLTRVLQKHYERLSRWSVRLWISGPCVQAPRWCGADLETKHRQPIPAPSFKLLRKVFGLSRELSTASRSPPRISARTTVPLGTEEAARCT